MATRKTSGRQRPLDIERLGRYRLVRPLSKGGMALVFEGRRESLAGVSPRVAVKLILPEHADSDTFQELFINEARLGASMHHQNLVQIQDFDRDGDHFFLVMEYVEGLTLRQVVGLCVRHDIPIPIGVIAELGRQACDGLHYAHEASDERGVHLGLVHRDVKPSNLMLNPQGVVKILDFGISKGNLVTEKVGAIRGTWGYMAPEQAFGRELGPNADVFGLATILYEMASRKALFRKKKPDEIKRLLDDDHAARMAATLPSEYGPIVGVLVRALQRDPAARYATASDFGRALSMLLPDPITARDRVVNFYNVVNALDQGRPVPGGVRSIRTGSSGLALPGPAAATPTHGSLVSPGSDSGVGFPWGWLLGGAVGAVLLVAAGVGVGLAIISSGVQPVVVAPVAVRSDQPLLDLDAFEDPTVVQGEVPEDDLEQANDPVVQQDPVQTPPTVRRVPVRRTPVQSVGAHEVVVDTGTEVDVRVVPDEPEQPVVVRIDRTPDAEITIVEVQPAPPPPPSEPVAVGFGYLTLSAQPYGQEYDVFIDGKLVPRSSPRTPLVKYKLPSGEHFVTISVAGGGRKQFEIAVKPDQHLRKIWDFERNQWRR